MMRAAGATSTIGTLSLNGRRRSSAFSIQHEDLLAFVIGAACSTRLHVGGDMPLGEALLALVFPYLVHKYRDRIMRPGNIPLFSLLGIWLVSQTASDLVNATSLLNQVKGAAAVIFFAIDIAGFSMLINRSPSRMRAVVFGFAASELIGVRLNGWDGALAWKYGGSIGASMVIAVIGSYLIEHRRYAIYTLLMLFLAFLNLHYGYRSQIAIDLVTVTLTLPIGEANVRPAAFKTIVLLIFSVGAIWLSQKVVQEAVKRDYFEESIEQKFQAQDQGQLGVLLGARPEIPAALQAIWDDPILGHGSYAIDPKYMQILADYQFKYGYSGGDNAEDLDNPGIPSHSHLTQTWIAGGVLASLFWFYLLYLLSRGVIYVSSTRPPLAPLYIFLFVTFFWDILFSPFGYDRRINEALYITMLVNCLYPAQISAAKAKAQYYVKRVYRAAPNLAALPRIDGRR